MLRSFWTEQESRAYSLESAFTNSSELSGISLEEARQMGKWTEKLFYLAVGLFSFEGLVTYTKDDLDMEVVEKLQQPQYKKHLEAVGDWIWDPDYDLAPKLEAAKRTLTPLLKMDWPKKLYRGFNLNNLQNTMGLDEEDTKVLERVLKWTGSSPKKISVGDRFEFASTSPLSFTNMESQASVFGQIVVAVDTSTVRNRILPITNELHYAIIMQEAKYVPSVFKTYGECVVLPNRQPIRFEVVSKK